VRFVLAGLDLHITFRLKSYTQVFELNYMCTVCVTEFDSIAATRGGMQDSMSSRRLLSELLLQLTEQKQLQASDAQLLKLKLASTRPPAKRTRTLKRPSDNENEDHSSGMCSYPVQTSSRGAAYLHQ
jgi:hypothetical protein